MVLATTVFLSFISFWRASAIVLSDLGSSAFYVGGIVEQALGKAAPWFILGVMLFSYAVRAVYIESSVMFVRGGVYRVVKEAMGGSLAKLSVSALLFDYVLTGPISAVSAGQYITALANDLLARAGLALRLPLDAGAVLVALAIIGYFWRRNTQGLHESSHDAVRIMAVTTVMVVILLAWSAFTLWLGGGHLPPLPVPANLRFSHEALGWLDGTIWPSVTAIAVLVGLGHSLLAMSGEESLAQVYRELEHPKARNLRRTGLVIFLYSLTFTSMVSFLAVALIPDGVRPRFYDNLIAGLAMHLAGPQALRLCFQAFVVLVGFLILAGAVNTAIVGSNAVVNRVSEDGVLTDWFRRPHRRFGTTYRIINSIVLLQVLTVLISRGNVYVLGEAYAFGVVWSFALKALAVLVLRFRRPGAREWRVPGNLRIGRVELPVGLGLIAVSLFALALVNLFTKQVATISGLAFTVVLFATFTASERVTRKRDALRENRDQFQLVRASRRWLRFGVGAPRRRPRSGSRLQHAQAPRVGALPDRHGIARHRRADRADHEGSGRGGRRRKRRRALHRLRATALHARGRRGGTPGPACHASRGSLDEPVRRDGAHRGPAALQPRSSSATRRDTHQRNRRGASVRRGNACTGAQTSKHAWSPAGSTATCGPSGWGRTCRC